MRSTSEILEAAAAAKARLTAANTEIKNAALKKAAETIKAVCADI